VDSIYRSLMAQGYKFHEIDGMDFACYLALIGREEARKHPLYGARYIDEAPFFSAGAR